MMVVKPTSETSYNHTCNRKQALSKYYTVTLVYKKNRIVKLNVRSLQFITYSYNQTLQFTLANDQLDKQIF
jgi:hypothetical protein